MTQSWCLSSAEADEQIILKTIINVNSICTTAQRTLTASAIKIEELVLHIEINVCYENVTQYFNNM
jgi:hypothetical protein